ncbi:sugar phosphate isomerase/epimerase family protein [Hutsoniella sourekii]
MILISTLPFVETSFTRVFDVLDQVEDTHQVGIEIFPVFRDDQFNQEVEANMDHLKDYPISLHGPYFGIEHSAEKGTDEYEVSVREFKETLDLSQALNGRHIVFHYNNKVITPENKEATIRVARENLQELNEWAQVAGVPILFENTGVNARQNNLFTQEEFIEEALSIENGTLFDVGHAYANGWNIEEVITQLKDKIKVYHLNNNMGADDDHLRILEGSLDYEWLADLYKQYTPQADLVLEYGDNVASDLAGIAADVAYLQANFLN